MNSFGSRLAAFVAIAGLAFVSGCQWNTNPDLRAVKRDISNLDEKNAKLEKRLFGLEKDVQKIKPCKCKERRGDEPAEPTEGGSANA